MNPQPETQTVLQVAKALSVKDRQRKTHFDFVCVNRASGTEARVDG